MSSKHSNTKISPYKITWSIYSRDIKKLAKSIKSYSIIRSWKFDGIIPIFRGGLVMGCNLSNILQISLVNPNSHKKNRGFYLVVDDVSDSGQTLKKFTRKLKLHKIKYIVATLYRKDRTIYEPDFCVRTINKWIVYPWET